MSFMLAASNPCSRKASRAPSMICRRLALSSAVCGSAFCWTFSWARALIWLLLGFFADSLIRSALYGKNQLFLTEPFGHIDCRSYYQYLMNEPFGQYISGEPSWVNGSFHCFPHKTKSAHAVWRSSYLLSG